ncbi:MAG TPA: hypothetical protein VL490_03435 [Mucilaginibacter sp.]|jgi:hypothetical protein|nr:hypothetical protein [Mucilaginibacter sp.]
MKTLSSLILLSIFLFGCSAKTHNLSNSKSSKDIKNYTDSTNQKKTEIINKSIIITNKDIDTSVFITGKTLIGYINKQDTSIVHFENDDINLDLQTNQISGLTRAVVMTKTRKETIKIHEKTTVNNDIQTIADVKSNLKTKSEVKTSSSTKLVADYTEPIITKGFKTAFIAIILLIVIAGIIVYLIKKYSVAGMVIGWIKNLF